MWKVVLLALLTLFATHASAEGFSLAYSKNLGVEVLAEGSKLSWCKTTPKITLVANNKAFFEKTSAPSLLGKIGKGVIEKKCPKATSLSVQGRVKGSPEVIWSGQAKKSAGWLFEKVALAAPVIATAKLVKEEAVSNKNVKKAAVSAGKLNSSSKTGNLFAVAGWQPLASPGMKVEPEESFKTIFSKSGDCKIRLNLRSYLREDFEGYYEPGKESEAVCVNGFLNGKANVGLFSISRGKLKQKQAIKAWFIEGVPVGGKRLNKPLVEGFESPSGRTVVTYYLGSDESMKVHFIGKLIPALGGNKWWSCGDTVPMYIITDNEQVFEDELAIEPLMNMALKHVLAVCPKLKRLEVVAKRKIRATGRSNKDVFYEVALHKKRSGVREFSQGRAKNFSLNRKQEKQRQEKMAIYRRWQQANGAYRQIENLDKSARVAFLHGVSSIDNPLSVFLTKLGSEQELSADLFVRVSGVDGDNALTDWPVEMKLTNTLDQISEEGWYILTGIVELDEPQDLVRHGFPKGIIDVSKVTTCQEKACGEANDVTSLIRARFDLPEWEHGKQPASPY